MKHEKRLERLEKKFGADTIKFFMSDGTIKLLPKRRLLAAVKAVVTGGSEDVELIARSTADDGRGHGCGHLGDVVRVLAAARCATKQFPPGEPGPKFLN